jgi:PAS domain-containing protein
MIYKFRKGSFIKGDPQAIGERLVQIRKTRGQLTPPDVVQEASRGSSVLHGQFEWDNEVAGHEWRLQQARHLIACVMIVEDDDHELTQPIRAFVNLSADGESSYENTIEVMSDTTLRERVLDALEADMERQREKLQAFSELAEVIDGIEIVQQRVKKARQAGSSRHGVAATA